MAQAAKKQQPISIQEEIEQHKKNGSNILIPFTKLEPSEFHKPVIDEVYLSVENNDAYHRGQGKYALTFQGLNRLAVCAGVQWHPYETKRTDNGTDRLYIAFRAVGGVKKADGSMIWHAANYDLDLEIIKEEIEEQQKNAQKQYKFSDEELQRKIETNWRQKRRHRHALAESGAKARVLRSLLNVKGLYSKQELEKPFVVVRYVFQPPTDDPAVRRQLIQDSMASMKSVYGSAALPYYPQKDDYIDIPPAEAATDAPVEAPAENEAPPDPAADPGPEYDDSIPFDDPGQGPEGEDDFPIMDEQQWADASTKEKETEIRRVAAHVGYDLENFEKRAGKPLAELEVGKLNSLYKNLCGMVQT